MIDIINYNKIDENKWIIPESMIEYEKKINMLEKQELKN